MIKHACPSCGATLGIPDEHERMFTCSFCGTVLEDSSVNPSAREATSTPQITIVTGWADTNSLPSYAGERQARGIVTAVILLVVIGIGIAIAIAVGTMGDTGDEVASGGGGPSSRSAGPFEAEPIRHLEIVPTDDGAGHQLLAITGSDRLTMRSIALEADESLQWSDQLPVNRSSDYSGFAVSDHAVYTTVGNQLLGWERASGQRLFATTISDSVKRYCADCLQIVDGTVVVLSGNGVLSGRDADTGDELWSTTLAIDPRQIITTPDLVGVIDAVEERTHSLRWFDPVSGADHAQLPLGCGAGSGPFPASTLGQYDYLVPLPDGLIWQSTSIITSCAVRWVHGESAYRWDTPVPDGSPASSDAEDFLHAGDRVLAPDRDGIRSYDVDTGEAVLIVPQDENLSIIGAADGLVYLASESTRGSRPWSVIAVDPATGARRWNVDMIGRYADGRQPKLMHTGWYAQPVEGGLVVATYDDDADTLTVQVLSREGQWSDAEAISLRPYSNITWPDFYGVAGQQLIVKSGTSVLVIDIADGTLVHEWG